MKLKVYHYGSLDGLRTISCLGIMMMHIQANTNYNISGPIWINVIPSFTWLVFLFFDDKWFWNVCGISSEISFKCNIIRRFLHTAI